ncbi:MAG: hypothetical protein ACFFD4_18675 [Candidatus Odinarchaeota archaeon]
MTISFYGVYLLLLVVVLTEMSLDSKKTSEEVLTSDRDATVRNCGLLKMISLK